MALDVLEWIGVVSAVLGVLGGLYAIVHGVPTWICNSFPQLSYKVETEPVYTSRGPSKWDPQTRELALNFTVWNRTSRDAILQCGAVFPIERTDRMYRGYSLVDARMIDQDTTNGVPMSAFPVRARNGRRLAIFGGLLPQWPDQKVVQLSMHDDRIGRRKWEWSRDLEVPAFPEPLHPPSSTGSSGDSSASAR